MSLESSKASSMRWQVLAWSLLALLLMIGLGLGIAYRHDLFTRTAELYFLTNNANNLAPGTTVRLSGYRVGAVSEMTMQPDLKVRVTLTVGADAFANLRSDAHASLVREQLRAPALELFAGSAAASLPASKPEIVYHRGATLTEMADELRARVGPILDDVKQLTGMLRDKQDDMRALVDNMRVATQELASASKDMRLLAADARGRVGSLGAELQTAAGTLSQSIGRTGAVIGQAETALGKVNESLPGMLQKADRTLEQLQGAAAEARQVTAAAAVQLPPLMRSVAPLVDDARDMARGLKQAWPLSSLLPAPPALLLPIDSQDAKALRALPPQ